MKISALFITVLVITNLFGCKTPTSNDNEVHTWQKQFDEKLPLLGHRNWILIVDKAFPEQNSPGIAYVYANERLVPVLKEVLLKLAQSKHIKPIIYQDMELGFVKEEQAKGIDALKKSLKGAFGGRGVQALLHDSVFKKLDTEAKLFKVLVIKTDEVIPYSSVFLQLDCAYWNAEKEMQLRTEMKGK